ncbi:MAG: AI-2E family transporter [Eubacteriales bacterium]|jgi:predicted PurR-regulated permease PerM|nr:AI-2E family transporter [Eubacteriales bacterium]
MKIEWNKKYTAAALYACAVAAAVVLCVFLVINIKSVAAAASGFVKLLNPIIIGFIIAYLFNPVIKLCERRVFAFVRRPKAVRVLSLTLTYAVFFVMATLFAASVIPQIVISYNDLVSRAGTISAFGRAGSSFIDMGRIKGYLSEWISDSYNITRYITGFFAGLLGQLKNALLGIVLSVYFLHSKERITVQLKKTMYAFLPQKTGDGIVAFLRFTDETFGGFIIGKLLDSLIVGIVTFIVLALFDMPYYQMISVIIGAANIIPFFGPFIGAIPAALIIYIADPSKVIWFIVIIIIIQQIDGNIIAPKILGETTGLGSLGVIVAVTVSGGLLGVAGMFVGVPLFALLYVGFTGLVNRRIAKKAGGQNIKNNAENYKNVKYEGET